MLLDLKILKFSITGNHFKNLNKLFKKTTRRESLLLKL